MGNCVLSFFPFLFLVTFEDIFNHATETSQSITFLDILIKSPQKTKPITKYPLITFYACFFLGSNFCYKNTFCIERKQMDFSSFFLLKKNISQNGKILPQYIYCLIINFYIFIIIIIIMADKTLHPGNKNVSVN